MGCLTAEWAAYANPRPKRLGSMAQIVSRCSSSLSQQLCYHSSGADPFRMPWQLCPAAMEDPWMPGTFSIAGEPSSEMGR